MRHLHGAARTEAGPGEHLLALPESDLPRAGSLLTALTGLRPDEIRRARREQVREAAHFAAGTRLYDLCHTHTTVAQEQLAIPRWRVELIIGHAPNTGDMTGKYTQAADPGLLENADRISEWLWTALTGEVPASDDA